MILKNKWVVVFAIGLFVASWTGQAKANFTFTHSGSLDPITEVFAVWPFSDGGHVVGPVYNDMGYEAWSIKGLPRSSQYAYYSEPLSISQNADIANQGFVLTVTERVAQGVGPVYTKDNPFIISATVVSTGSKRFDIDLGVDSNGDTVVILPDLIGVSGGGLITPGASFTLTGSGSSYHTYQLVYHPTTQLADLFVDGIKRIQDYPGFIYYSPIEGNSRGMYSTLWGAINGGEANFNFVQFTSSPSPIPGDCDASGKVTIAEVQAAINMYLGLKTPSACVDLNGDGVSIDEVQKVINGYLGL